MLYVEIWNEEPRYPCDGKSGQLTIFRPENWEQVSLAQFRYELGAGIPWDVDAEEAAMKAVVLPDYLVRFAGGWIADRENAVCLFLTAKERELLEAFCFLYRYAGGWERFLDCFQTPNGRTFFTISDGRGHYDPDLVVEERTPHEAIPRLVELARRKAEA